MRHKRKETLEADLKYKQEQLDNLNDDIHRIRCIPLIHSAHSLLWSLDMSVKTLKAKIDECK